MRLQFEYNDGGRSNYFKAKNVNDCVVRSISIATGKKYIDVYKDLFKLSGVSPRNGVRPQIYKKYLKQLGWEWVGNDMSKGDRMKMRFEDIPHGTVILRVSKHLVTVIDGVIYDTSDPSRDGNRLVYGYFIKRNNKP